MGWGAGAELFAVGAEELHFLAALFLVRVRSIVVHGAPIRRPTGEFLASLMAGRRWQANFKHQVSKAGVPGGR